MAASIQGSGFSSVFCVAILFSLLSYSLAWTFVPSHETSRPTTCYATPQQQHFTEWPPSRRSLLKQATLATALALVSPVYPARADSSATQSAEVTDRIFLNIKGLPAPGESAATASTTRTVVIGLFGKDAPACTAQIKQLVSPAGLPAVCRPRAEKTLQKDQLEANKVYNSCIENESQGVPLAYSTIWRVIKDERIDVGAVTGKFVAREFPQWEDQDSALKHDMEGVVSVRRGSDGGFGFTIYPGSDGKSTSPLDAEHIVIGRVLEGMDVVRDLNEVPVITSAKINYMGLTGGPKTKSAPDRSCRYGGNMYCNENKPLIKLSIAATGVL